MPVIYKCLRQARAFFLGKPFQLRLMLVGKARAYPSEAPFRFFTEAVFLVVCDTSMNEL